MKLRLVSVLLVSVLVVISCDLFTIGLGEVVDIEAPEVWITTPSTSTTEYKKSDFSITGSVSDDVSGATVTVSWGSNSVQATVKGEQWSAVVPSGLIPNDGTLNIMAVATDETGKKSAPAYVNVEIDRKAPTVLVSTPQIYSPSPTYADYVVIQGESWDTAPLVSVYVEVWDPLNPETPAARKKAEGDRSWFARIELDEAFTDQTEYRYRVLATDKSGNVNTYQIHASDVWDLLPAGELFPAMVDIGKWDQQGTAIPLSTGGTLTPPESVKIPTTGDPAKLGFIHDANKDNPQISLSNLDANLPITDNTLGVRVPIFASAIDDKEGIDTGSVSLSVIGIDDPGFSGQVSGADFNSPGDGLYTSFQFNMTGAAELSPGRYQGELTAADNKGTESALVFQFLVDRGTPRIVSVSPSDNYIAADENGNINATVRIQDDNPDPTLTALFTNDALPDGSNELPSTVSIVSETTGVEDEETVYIVDYLITALDPVPDDVTLEIDVTDSAGLQNTRTLHYTVDRVDPVVVINTPSDGSLISGSAMTAAGTSSEDTLRVFVYLQNALDGPTAPDDLSLWEIADGNQTWSLPLDLSLVSQGNYILFARAEDLAGNYSAVESAEFSYDLFAPDLTEDAIGVSDVVDSSTGFELSGTAFDSNGLASTAITATQKRNGDAALPIDVNGPATVDGWANWTLSGLPRDGADIGTQAVVDGTYVYAITATDVTGRTTTLTRTVRIDPSPPTLSISSPAEGSWASTTSITVSGTASDGLGGGVTVVEYSTDYTDDGDDANDTWTTATGTSSWSVELTSLTEGYHAIALRATDTLGNMSGATIRNFGVDLNRPSLTSSTPPAQTSTGFSLSGTALDSNALAEPAVTVTQKIDSGVPVTISTNGPATSDSWANWELNNLPRDSSAIGAQLLADGVYEYAVTVTDVAGKSETVTRTVLVDITPPGGTVTSPAEGENVGGASFTFSGTADDSGSGVKRVQYSFDDSNWVDAAGTESWSATVDLAVLGVEGPKTVYLRVEDFAGNLSTAAGSIVGNFVYDTAVPTVSIDGGENIDVFTGFTLTGTAADSYGIASVDITQQEDGGSVITVDSNGPSTSNNWGTWTLADLPRDPLSIGTQDVTDGVYVYSATATDLAGKTSLVASVTVTIDSTAPEVLTISNPAAGQTGSNSLTGSAYTLRGSVGDAGVGVAKLYYLIDTNASAPAGIAGYSELLTGDGTWSVTLDFDTDGAGPDTGDLGEGSWNLHVKAEDGAGNRTADADAVSVAFDLDYADPTLAETTIGTSVKTNTNTGFSFAGTSSDSNGVASIAVTQAKDGGSVVPVDVNGPSTGDGWANWTLSNLPRDPADIGTQALTDGVYEYVITATDVVGKVTTVMRTVHLDSAGPNVVIDVPAASDVVSNATVTVAGTADDGIGTGVVGVEYSLDYTDDGNDLNDTWTALSGTTNWNKSVNLGAEGPKTIYVRAWDQLNQYSAVESVSFSLDLTSPSLDETGIGPATAKRSGDFSLSGTASDTNGLKTWDDPIDGLDGVLVPYVEISRNGGTAVKVTVSGGNWAYNENTSGFTDGDYTYTITATDVVDKVTTLTRFVSFDSTNPTIAIDGVIAGLNVSTGEVNGDITFRFNADDAGVGLEKSGSDYLAYYKLVDDGVVPPTGASDIATWTQITSASTVFSFILDTVNAPEITGAGPYDLYIGVRDAVTTAPNVASSKYDLQVNQDSDRPIITVDNLDETAVSNNENGLGQNPSVLVTIQDDDAVDISELQYRIDVNNDQVFDGATADSRGDGTAGNQKWEDESVWYSFDELPASDQSLVQGKILLSDFPQGVFGIQIRARDNKDASLWSAIFDDSANYTWDKTNIILFSVDYGPPTLSITSPSSGTYNANLEIIGTATDALGVIEVKYSLIGDPTSIPETVIFSGDQQTVTINATNYPNALVDISTMDTGEYILQVVATDQGNYSVTQQIPITIDKDPPSTNILQPSGDDSLWLNGSAVAVTGEATDNRLVGAVFLWHGLVGAPDPALPSRTAPDTYDSGGYTQLAGKGVWSTTIDTTGEVLTAVNGYRIRVAAVDSIGNVGAPEELLVQIDQEADRPVIEFSNISEITPSRLGTGPRIIGTVSDDDSVDHTSLQIRFDRNGDGDYSDADEGWAGVSNSPTAPGTLVSWYHDIGEPISQGLWYVQVRAYDINGSDYVTGYSWGETASVQFYIDYGPPALSITSPNSGQRFNVDNFTITGTTNDGNGVDYYTVWADDDDDQVQDAGEFQVIGWIDDNTDGIRDAGEIRDIGDPATRTGPLTTDDTTFNINTSVTGLTDGVKAIQVISYDTAAAGSVRDFTVVIDTTDPTVSFSTPTSGATVNGEILISGLASDNYQLSNVYYHIGLTGATPAPVYPADYTALDQTYSWSVSEDTATLPDGDGGYTISIVPLDSAGNYPATPDTRAITVDQEADRPKIQLTSITEGNTAAQNLIPADKSISGSVQDDDGVVGAGIEVRVWNAAGNSEVTGWEPLASPPADGTFVTWSKTLSVADGQYQIQVRAYDTLTGAYTGFGYDDRFQDFVEDGDGGNDTDYVNFAVDTSNPTVTVTGPQQNYFTNDDSITFSGTSDDGSGVTAAQVRYRLQGDPSYTDLTTNLAGSAPFDWDATLDTVTAGLGDGVYDWQIEVEDPYGKTGISDRILTLDKTAPVVNIASPAAATVINGSMLVSGTATDKWKTDQDGFQVNSVRIWIGAGLSPTPPATTSYYTRDDTTNTLHDATNWKELTGTSNWSYRYDTTGLNGDYTIFVVAVDNSGNVSPSESVTVNYDQSQNLPVVDLLNRSYGEVTGTIDSAATTTFTDDALNGNADIDAGWYVQFTATPEIRKVASFDDGTDTVTFTPALSATPSGGYILFPNVVGAGGTVQGEVTDDDGVNASSIQIAIDVDGDGTIDTAGAEPFVNVGSTTVVGNAVQFTHDISGPAEGLVTYRFIIRAEDIGEPSFGVSAVERITEEIVFARDNAAPAAPTLTELDNGYTVKTTGLVGSNLNNYLDLLGTASDTVRAAAVDVKVGTKVYAPATNTGTHFSTWSFSDPQVSGSGTPLPEGQLTVLVKVTDAFGKETIESFVFNIDTTGPSALFDNPTAGSLLNGSFLTTGTASDTYTVSTVYYYVEDSLNPAPGDVTTWPTATGTASWNFRFDSTGRTNGEKTLNVVARDNAGNIGATETRTVYFDDFLNQPIIRLNGLSAPELRGTANSSTTTSVTDASLIGNSDIEAGWMITFPDGVTETVSGFDSGTGEISLSAALAAAYPAGSGFIVEAPTYAVTATGASSVTDDAGPATLVGNTSITAGWAVIFDNGTAPLTSLVTGFDSGTGTLTLESLPGGIGIGSTFRVLPKTLLGAGATISGTLSDDDGIDTATVEIAMDLDNDGNYTDPNEGFQAVTSTAGSGTSVSFTDNLTNMAESTTVYKVKIRVYDIGQPAYAAEGGAPVLETTGEYLVARDNSVPGSPVFTRFENGYYGDTNSIGAKTTDIENSFINTQISLEGTASDGVGVALVEVNVNSLGYEQANNTVAWDYSRSGLALTSGNNVPVLVRVTDYWGRQTVSSFNFKADATVPTISFPAFGRKLNATETIQGTSGDLNSSVHAVYLWKGTTAVTPFDPAAPETGGWSSAGITNTTTWSYIYDTTVDHNLASDQAYNLAFTAADQAGNFTTLSRSETINQDSDRPVIEFSSINITGTAAENRFDSNPRITGSITDDDGVDNDKVLISIDGSAYVLVTDPPSSDGTAGGTVTFSHELVDITGIADSSTTTTLTDADLTGEDQIVLGAGAVPVWEIVFSDGTVEDITAFDSGAGTVTFAAQGAAPTGSYTVRLKEGEHTVSLRVGDITSGAYLDISPFDRNAQYNWEQSDGDATADWQNDPSDFAVDTGAPVINFTQFFMADRYSGIYGGSDINITDEGSMAAQTVNNDWTLSGNAADGALASVTVKVDSGTPVTPDSFDAGTGDWSHLFDWLTTSPGQGSHTITVTAVDAYGKTTVKTLSVVLDSVEPVLTMTSPVDTTPADNVFDSPVNGTVYMTGSLSEAALVELWLGDDVPQPPSGATDYTSGTPVATWSHNFDSADPALANTTKSTLISGDDDSDGTKDANEIWAYTTTVQIVITDAAGNVNNGDTIFTLQVDENTDRPTASITLPANNSYRAGEILVNGLTSDDSGADDGVSAVWVQIDANGDSDFTDVHTFAGTGNGTAGDDPYEDETRWYKVPDDQLINAAAWSLAINGNGSLDYALTPGDKNTATTAVTVTEGELYASNTGYSGMINIRVLAVDNHGQVGLESSAVTVFLDESYPEIKGITVGGGAFTPGLATLVSGSTTISALFRDDQQASLLDSKLQIKYNQEAYAAIDATNIFTTNWDGYAEDTGNPGYPAYPGDPVHVLKKAGTTPVSGTSTSTTVASLTSTALDGLAFQTGMVVYLDSATKVIDSFDDTTDTIDWTGDVSGLSATEPFIVAEPMMIDTQGTLGGIDYTDGEGALNIILRATDETNQAVSTTIELNVDNQRPTGEFNSINSGDTLTYIGADRNTGLYTFSGNDQTNNKLIGDIIDSGAISGVEKVSLYFVKDTDSDGVYDDGVDAFWSPRSDQTSTLLDASDRISLYNTIDSTADTVPYPLDSSYVIVVDKRTENLVYDDDGGTFGDGDGFQESLLSKAGYDLWQVFFDTTKLPDGPIWLFAVYEDTAGNRSYQRVNAQISNNPPSIESFDLNGTNFDSSDIKIKTGGDLTVKVNSTDVEGIEPSDYILTVDKHYTDGSGTVEDTGFIPFSFGSGLIYDFYDVDPAVATPLGSYGEISVPLGIFTDDFLDPAADRTSITDAGLVGGVDYTDWFVYFQEKDEYQAITSYDDVAGTVTFAAVNTGADTAELVYRAGQATGGTTTSMTDAALAGLPDLTGLRVLFGDENPPDEPTSPVHYITAYDDVTGTIDFSAARTSGPTNVNYRISPYFEDEWYRFTAKVSDTDGNSVTRSFRVNVFNEDGTAPFVEIDDFLHATHALTGHIEDEGSSLHSGTDADLSGTVKITGTAEDNASVTGVELSFDGGSNWVPVDSLVVTYTDPDGVENTEYAWTYNSWNTAGITGVAQDEFTIMVRATDGANTGSNTKVVDVVPYITDISGLGMDSGFSSYLKRSALGKYTVAVGSEITIKGYNLSDTGTLNVGTTTGLTPNVGGSSTQIVVPLGSTNTSGDVTVITNGVSSVNNVNEDTLSQNQEATAIFPDRLDDRRIQFWTIESHSTVSGKTEAVMRPDDAGTNMDWIYVQDDKYLYHYDGSADTTTNIVDSLGSLKGGDFRFNSSGTLLYLFFNNSTWTSDDDTIDDYAMYGSVQWGAGATYNGADRNWHRPDTARLGLGNQAYPNTGGAVSLNRYKNITLLTTGNDTDTTHYVAYFDSGSANRSIVFIPFSAGSGVGGATGLGTVNASTWTSTLTKGTRGKTQQDYSKTSNYEVGLETPTRYELTSGSQDSEHFAMALDGNVAIIAYYDEGSATKALKLIYNTNPLGAPSSWSAPQTIAENAGTYVSMAVDPSGGVHLAYYDTESSVLKYSFLSSYADTTPVTVTVDTIFSSGMFTDIQVRDFGGTGYGYRPVISEYSSAFFGSRFSVRVAYPSADIGTDGQDLLDGGTAGAVTGDWEIIAVPAVTTPQQADTFIALSDSSNPAVLTSDVVVGFNGTYIEEARLHF